MTNQELGAFGEQIIAELLTSRGNRIIDRNWRIREGEIDLIAKSPDGTFHFVEVKTRTSLTYGHPLESIDRDKANRLQRLALAWLATHGSFGCKFQIDCAGVLIDAAGLHQIDYRSNIL